MTRLQFNLQVPVQYVGTLVLMGTECDVEGSFMETIVYFACKCPHNEPLAGYLNPTTFFGGNDFPAEFMAQFDSPDHDYRLKLFSRKVKGGLRNPRKFLVHTARQLLQKLQHEEEIDLAGAELEDFRNWSTDWGTRPEDPVPDFSLPRHV